MSVFTDEERGYLSSGIRHGRLATTGAWPPRARMRRRT